MATVQDILRDKGSQVFAVGKDASVLEAALLMNEHKIGALVVIDSDTVVGIFTERDVLQRVVAARLDPAHTLVHEVMTTPVACCVPGTSLEEARGVMKNRRIRHLPVVDGQSRLLGMISIGDLNAYDGVAAEQTIQFLHEYIYGRT